MDLMSVFMHLFICDVFPSCLLWWWTWLMSTAARFSLLWSPAHLLFHTLIWCCWRTNEYLLLFKQRTSVKASWVHLHLHLEMSACFQISQEAFLCQLWTGPKFTRFIQKTLNICKLCLFCAVVYCTQQRFKGSVKMDGATQFISCDSLLHHLILWLSVTLSRWLTNQRSKFVSQR